MHSQRHPGGKPPHGQGSEYTELSCAALLSAVLRDAGVVAGAARQSQPFRDLAPLQVRPLPSPRDRAHTRENPAK